MNNEQLQTLARLGAQARLRMIEQERSALLAAFPGLEGQRTRAAASQQLTTRGPAKQAASQAPTNRKRRTMTAAERKAVGARMTAYWAKRRAEKAGADSAGTAGAKGTRKGRKGSKAR